MWTYYLQNNFQNKISIMISVNSINNCTDTFCISNSFFFFSDRINTFTDIGKTIIKNVIGTFLILFLVMFVELHYIIILIY